VAKDEDDDDDVELEPDAVPPPPVVSVPTAACLKETYQSVEIILCQVRNDVGGSDQRMFAVKWRSKKVGDTTIEPENLLPPQVVANWDTLVGRDLTVYDMNTDVTGVPNPWDIVTAESAMCHPCPRSYF
jgi:hypothetical protein